MCIHTLQKIAPNKRYYQYHLTTQYFCKANEWLELAWHCLTKGFIIILLAFRLRNCICNCNCSSQVIKHSMKCFVDCRIAGMKEFPEAVDSSQFINKCLLCTFDSWIRSADSRSSGRRLCST